MVAKPDDGAAGAPKPLTQDDLGSQYPEVIRPGETLRGVIIDGRETRRKGANRVLDLVTAGGVVRSVFEDRKLSQLFDAIDQGDFLEVTCVPAPGEVAAPAAPRSGMWARRAAPVQETQQGARGQRSWRFTLFPCRTVAAPAWADDELLAASRTVSGVEPRDVQQTDQRHPDDPPPRNGKGKGSRAAE